MREARCYVARCPLGSKWTPDGIAARTERGPLHALGSGVR